MPSTRHRQNNTAANMTNARLANKNHFGVDDEKIRRYRFAGGSYSDANPVYRGRLRQNG
jgi:hypothetical protein